MSQLVRLDLVQRAIDGGLEMEAAVQAALFGDVKVGVVKGDHASIAKAFMLQVQDGSPAPVVFCEQAWWRYCPAKGYWLQVAQKDIDYKLATIGDWAAYIPEARGRTYEAIKVSSSLTGSVLTTATQLARVNEGMFENAQPGLCFTNGFLRLDTDAATLTLEPHRHEQYARHQLGFAWDPEAGCSQWVKFLGEVWGGCPDADERQSFLSQFLGVCLLGKATVFNQVCLLLGTGANGKSVLCDVVAGLFPKSGLVSIPPQELHREGHLARIAGATLNLVSDIPGSELMDSGVFKQITSGDLLTARRLYQNPFEFRSKAGHIFSANTLPLSADHSPGFYRRWVVLGFPNRFDGSVTKEQLMVRLRACYPGIVRWAMEGALSALRRPGFLVPSSSREVLKEWRLMGDQVTAFLADYGYIHEQFRQDEGARRDIVYEDYSHWSARNGHARMSASKFYKRLTEIGVHAWQTTEGRMVGVTAKRFEPAQKRTDHDED